MDLGNYKIKVNSEAESKEVQEYLLANGLEKPYNNFTLHNGWVCIRENQILCVCESQAGSELDEFKELDLPQLHDLVVLHRNDVSDANYSLFISTSQPTLELYKTSSDKFYVYAHGHHAWTESFSVGINTPNLKAITHSTLEQGLISGADALRALADGKEVELQVNGDINWHDSTQWTVGELLTFKGVFRLKPRTITLNIEIPAPFEPKVGEGYFYLNAKYKVGYSKTMREPLCNQDNKNIENGAWRTEEEIKQVVAALRGALKNG